MLPHWELADGTYFVTFRLADSIPQSIIKSYKLERENIQRTAEQLNRSLSKQECHRLWNLYSEKVESALEQNLGECFLNQDAIAKTVVDALNHFDHKRYQLLCWCIMPNHVHILFKVIGNNDLKKILHSWKSFTAKQANQILNRTGVFWQSEYHDHLVRDQDELDRIVDYILANPIKAGLKDWKWTWVKE